jgi:hypothetical protein
MSKIEENENSKYDELFKNLLSKESNYEFFLKAQSLLKKELKKNSNSSNYISLLIYCINHLQQSDDKRSLNSLLDYSLEQYIKKNNTLPENISKEDFVKGFLKAFSLCKGLFNTSNFRIKFLYYCKKNNIEEKNLKLLKCYDIFAKGCISAKEYVDAYNYCIKSENINLLFELFEDFEKLCVSLNNDDKQNEPENPLYNYKILFKQLDNEELNILILRTTLELLINKKIELAFEFIGKYYNKNDKNKNAIINFGYNLVCLMIRKPHGFDDFWALINIYENIMEKRFDIKNYLNKISQIYYNKTFLNNNK